MIYTSKASAFEVYIFMFKMSKFGVLHTIFIEDEFIAS